MSKKEDLVETLNYRGFDIDILYDTDPMSPDEWGNSDVFIVYGHRQFTVQRKGFEPRSIFDHIEQTRRMFYDGYYVFVLFAYIHSGVSLSLGRDEYPFNDRWDVSSTGFVLVKRQKGWWTRQKALEVAKSEIEEWNYYLSGQVYGFNWEHGGCMGYAGDKQYCIDEAKAEVDGYIQSENQKRLKSHYYRLKAWIHHHVPLIYRFPVTLVGQ